MGDIEEGVLLVPVSEAAAALNVCRHTLYRMRNAEQIRFVKLRGKTLVPVSELERRRELMEAWARYLEASSAVVPFARVK